MTNNAWQPQAPDCREAKDVWQPQAPAFREAKNVWQPQAPAFREAEGRACGWMRILTLAKHVQVRKIRKICQKHAGDKWNDAGYRPSRLREVQYGEFPVVSLSGAVIGLGRTDFTNEAAEVYRLAVNANTHLPALIFAFPTDTLVFGTVSYIRIFCSVPAILRGSGWAQIGISIVQAVAVDVIHEQMVGDSAYLTMHEYLTLFSI